MTRNKYVGDMHSILSSANDQIESRCLYFDKDGKRCKKRAVASHSLQRRGPLFEISENGHVIKVGPELKAMPVEKREIFTRVGIAKASTFAGFCGEHDTEVFKEIETQSVTLDARTALIVAIRAISFEWYRKCVMVEIQLALLKHLGATPDKHKLDFAKSVLKGASMAVDENINKLRTYFSALHRNQFDTLWYTAAKFQKKIPFACTGSFEPEWDQNGNYLFKSDPMKTKWNSVSMLVGNVGGEGYAIFSGYQRYQKHRADKFFCSINTNSKTFSSDILTLCLAYSENVFLRESWHNNLRAEDRSVIKSLSISGVLEGIRNPENLKLRIEMDENPAVKVQTSW